MIPSARTSLVAALAAASFATVASAQTVLLQQDFESSTTAADYFNGTAPAAGQFSFRSFSSGSSIATAGDNNYYRVSFSGSSAHGFGLLTGFTPDATLLYVQFDLNVFSVSAAAANGLYVIAGDGLSNNNSLDSTTFASVRQGINLDTAGFSSGSSSFTGWQTVRLFANDSGASFNYDSPLGASTALAANTYDLWVGDTRTVAGASIGSAAFDEIKFRVSANTPVIGFDNFYISQGFPTAIPEPSALAALAGLGALGFVGSRRRRRA